MLSRQFQTDGGDTRLFFGSFPIVAALTAFILLASLYIERMVPQTVVALPFGVMMLIVAVFLASVWLMVLNEEVWIALAILALATFVVRTADDAIGIEEVIYSVYGPPGLVFWFVRELFFKRKRLVHSTFDWMLLASVTICLSIALISTILHEGEMKFFVREFTSFFMILIYFPIRKFLKDDRAVYRLVLLITVLAVFNVVMNFLNYQERVVQSLMAYGEVNARSAIFEHLSIVFVCMMAAWVTFAKEWKWRIVGIGLFSLGAVGLVISLSRGPVVGAMAGIVAGLAFVPFSRSVKFFLTFIAIAIINIGLAYVLFPSMIESVFANIGGRAATMEKLSGDASLQSRILEAKTLINRRIPDSPVIGHGYGVRYLFYDLAVRYSHRTGYTHNGYLFPIYKFGLPAGLFFLLTLFAPLFRIPFSGYRQLSYERRMVLVGAVSSLVGLLVANLTAQNISLYIHVVLYASTLAVIDYLLADERIVLSRRRDLSSIETVGMSKSV
ncbi:MAG: O-antigen ligase family protein [Ignavibacteriae bacterium]|nr:O-antigen ligase family protein [Ignavibacteriota bacterium]MCB9217036.1 O-antigen ligase family protein [Ignavibacteria bacterium]